MDIEIAAEGRPTIFCRMTTVRGMSCYTSFTPFIEGSGIGDRREEALTREHIQMIAYGVASRSRDTITFEYVDDEGRTQTDKDVVLRESLEITVSR